MIDRGKEFRKLGELRSMTLKKINLLEILSLFILVTRNGGTSGRS